MNTHVNSLQPRDLPKPRRQRKSSKLSWIDSRHASGGNKKRPAPTRSPHTGKPTPIRPPGESYCDTKPGGGWVDTVAQGRNQYQHQGRMGRGVGTGGGTGEGVGDGKPIGVGVGIGVDAGDGATVGVGARPSAEAPERGLGEQAQLGQHAPRQLRFQCGHLTPARNFERFRSYR